MEKRNPFELLQKTGLYGKGLLSVHDVSNIEHYNQCLIEIGIEPTALTTFSIDGMGYSPEIAIEKGDPQYLSHGGISNPYGIILSPEQEGLPVYCPYYSFYREIMDEMFRTFRRQITDITLRTGCYIDLDDGFAEIRSPYDLLMMEGIIVKFHSIGTVTEDAKRQREIVSLLLKDENWSDQGVIDELKGNVEKNGDLRHQSMQLVDMPFMDVQSFYTAAFGGIYIFRGIDSHNHVIVHVESTDAHRVENGHSEYRFADPDLYEQLLKHNIIDLQAGRYRRNIGVRKLKRLAECLFVSALTSTDTTIDIVSMTEPQRAKIALRLMKNGQLSPVYKELLELAHTTQLNRQNLDAASADVQKILAHPHKEVKGSDRKVVHRLLLHLMPVDIIDLFAYAKETFYELYATWPENKQAWAVALLQKQYVPLTERKNNLIFTKKINSIWK